MNSDAGRRRLERVAAGNSLKPPMQACGQAAAAEKEARAEIESPEHYKYSKVEPINVIEAWKLGFCLGNVVKYLARAAWKHNKLQDLKKAAWYLKREIERLENE